MFKRVELEHYPTVDCDLSYHARADAVDKQASLVPHNTRPLDWTTGTGSYSDTPYSDSS